MRGMFAILAAAIALSSCSQAFDMTIDAGNYARLGDGFDLEYHAWPEIEEPEQIARWIYHHVDYEWDVVDHWQSPKETLDNGTGDCEDFAILYMNILYVKWGVKSDLVFVMDDGRSVEEGEVVRVAVCVRDVSRRIEKGGWYNHAVVWLDDGNMISAQGGRVCHADPAFVYTFDEVFR